ncbi:MAG TPA: hypothetical protein DCQ14_01515 [Firmicutes bacterium]|nr:hypothetical protein [Bacillota bacterium]
MSLAAAEYGAAISQTVYTWRPVAVVLFPMAAALVAILLGIKGGRWVAHFSLGATVLTLLGVLSLYPLLQQGTLEHYFYRMMKVGLLFRVDYLGFSFALLICIAWLLAMLYAVAALERETARHLYFPFSLLTLGSCLGVVLTGDLFSLFFFFELMTLSSYFLIISRRSSEAIAAGSFTLFMGLAGGLVMLFGIIALYSAAGTVELVPLMELIGDGNAHVSFIFACLFIGFGIKALVVPLHLWIPRAYAAAPAAVNALSSGAMIKVGIYGILRLLFVLFTPTAPELGELVNFARGSGYLVMWLGLLTMVAGAVMALQQENIMKLLAYSSVSQMGYIIAGAGAGAYLFGLGETLGYGGAVLHAFNHTLFKVAFIIIAGIVYYCCGEVQLGKLGGLWRKMPLLAAFFLVSMLAIAGVPGLNGYTSKKLIQYALLGAYNQYGGLDIFIAEKVFLIGAALTLCYYLKFFQGVFGGAARDAVMQRRPPGLLYLPLCLIMPLMLLIGLAPNYFMDALLIPSAKAFSFTPDSIKYVAEFSFFSTSKLGAAFTGLLPAVLFYLLAARLGWLTRPLPRWLSIEYLLFAPLLNLAFAVLLRSGGSLDDGVNRFYYRLAAKFINICSFLSIFDKRVDCLYSSSGTRVRYLVESFRQVDDTLNEAYTATGKAARELAGRTTILDQALDKSYERAGEYARNLAKRTGELDEALDEGYTRAGNAARQLLERRDGEGPEAASVAKHHQRKSIFAGINPLEWNIRNLSFDSLLMAVMLGLVIFVLLFFARGLI